MPSASSGSRSAGWPCEVDRQDRLRPLGDGAAAQLRIDVEVAVADVDEDRRRAGVDDDVRGRGPGDRGRDHLVAGADAERDEREVHRRRPGGDARGRARPRSTRQRAARARGARPGRQPAGAQRLGDGGDLLLADRRRLEAEHGSSTSVWSQTRASTSTVFEANMSPQPRGARASSASLAVCRRRPGPRRRGRHRGGTARSDAPARGRSARRGTPPVQGLRLCDALDLAQLPGRRDEEADAGAAYRARRARGRRRRISSPSAADERSAVQVDAERRRGRAPRRARRRAARRARTTRGAVRPDERSACSVGPFSIPSAAAAARGQPRRRAVSAGSSSLGHTCASATPNAGGARRQRSVTVSGEKRAAGRERR